MRTARRPFLLVLLLPVLLALLGPVPSAYAASSLTNGCAVSARGIPTCGAFIGGAYGGNADVKPWESAMGKKLGVHRTFWGSGSVASAGVIQVPLTFDSQGMRGGARGTAGKAVQGYSSGPSVSIREPRVLSRGNAQV